MLIRVAVVSALLAVSGCADEQPARIPESTSFAGAIEPFWPARTPWVLVNSVSLCLDTPGTVEIVDAQLEYSDGVELSAYAVRPVDLVGGRYPEQVTFNETLEDLGFDLDRRTVDAVCHDEANGTDGQEPPFDLGLEFVKESAETARGAVVRLEYVSSGQTFTHRIGFELVLCETTMESAECQPGTPSDYAWE